MGGQTGGQASENVVTVYAPPGTVVVDVILNQSAPATIVSVTVGAANELFEFGAWANLLSHDGTENLGFQISFTDENGVVQTTIIDNVQWAESVGGSLSLGENLVGSHVLYAKAATTVTLSIVNTTGVGVYAYNAGGFIRPLGS